MIISIKNNWESARDTHTKFLNDKIINFLSKNKSRTIGKVKAKEFIEEVYHLLILCSRQDMEDSITIYKRYLTSLSSHVLHKKQFISTIKSLFNYKNFTAKTGEWNAYKLCMKSITRTCPYCNQAYAMTIQVDKRGCRPTLDHYYCKDKYPHLALVLNNFIPSCSTCNSSLKATTDFYSVKHLNPLWDDENVSFMISHIDGICGDADFFSKLERNAEGALLHLNPSIPCQKTQKSLETFLLQDRYDYIISEAVEFSLAKNRLLDAINTGIHHFADEDEAIILRFDKVNYNKYLLGRMYHDLSVQIEGFQPLYLTIN
ncbi:hypothetical protein AB9Q29_022890 (plasmid) [Pantoea vagans]|uniref:hypothetical protein n=1 Tax=Pantoea vagans TaxID=470934 RepID=UPI003515AFAD